MFCMRWLIPAWFLVLLPVPAHPASLSPSQFHAVAFPHCTWAHMQTSSGMGKESMNKESVSQQRGFFFPFIILLSFLLFSTNGNPSRQADSHQYTLVPGIPARAGPALTSCPIAECCDVLVVRWTDTPLCRHYWCYCHKFHILHTWCIHSFRVCLLELAINGRGELTFLTVLVDMPVFSLSLSLCIHTHSHTYIFKVFFRCAFTLGWYFFVEWTLAIIF